MEDAPCPIVHFEQYSGSLDYKKTCLADLIREPDCPNPLFVEKIPGCSCLPFSFRKRQDEARVMPGKQKGEPFSVLLRIRSGRET